MRFTWLLIGNDLPADHIRRSSVVRLELLDEAGTVLVGWTETQNSTLSPEIGWVCYLEVKSDVILAVDAEVIAPLLLIDVEIVLSYISESFHLLGGAGFFRVIRVIRAV